MFDFQQFILIIYIIQLIHSFEELSNGFHKKWFFVKLPFRGFLVFEIVHNIFWFLVISIPNFPAKFLLLGLFALLMFANGIEHIVWSMWEKKYVPGLITAIVHVILFTLFFLFNINKLIL